MALFGLSAAVPVGAQTQTGKEGTVIRFDKSTAHALMSNGASASQKEDQPFGLIRHDISPVQLFLSNKGVMQESGLYADIANGFRFDTSSNQFYLETNQTQDNNVPHMAIVAPKGFRIVQFVWDVDGAESQRNLTMQRVVYDGEGTETLTGDVFTVNRSQASQIWDVALNDASNTLYFKVTAPSTASILRINSLKVVYAIDEPYWGQLPSANGTTEVQTGVLDLGRFSRNSYNYWSFNKDYFTDFQSASIHYGSAQGGVADVTSSVEVAAAELDGGQYYVTASNGDYYVEAPEKFRVVGATLKFLRSNSSIEEVIGYTAEAVSSITSGGEYAIGDGNGHFLNYYSRYWTVGGSDAATATKWTITETSNGRYRISYVDPNDNTRYYLTNGTGGNSGRWVISTSPANFSYSSTSGFYYSSGSTRYYVTYDSGWKRQTSLATTSKPMKVESHVEQEEKNFTGGDFIATVYGRDGEAVSKEVSLSDAESSATVELSDFNNDAVRFSISGLSEGETALYSVNLRLLPLNPEVQNLSVGSKFGNNEGFENTTSFDSENYDFNGGEAVTIVVPEAVADTGTECTVEFLNADNEEKTKWYTDGSLENNPASTGGYSNFFLVGSQADKGTGDNVELDFTLGNGNQPDARTSATKAGMNGLAFTNIEELWDGPDEYLVQNEFKKTEANYADAKVTVGGDAKEFYIYSADQPTFQILNGSKHIDFRYYTLKVQCVKQVEEPEVTLVPIYKETLKSASRDGKIPSDANTLDTKHTFYGVKVKAVKASSTNEEIYGYLTSKSIMDAVKEKLAAESYYGFDEANALRGMLYLDISSLRRTDDTNFGADFRASVADNFLFFVPAGTSAPTDVTNIVTKTGETFVASSNIVVRDQQPFFTPYDFRTSNYYVKYEREGTATAAGGDNKAKVKNMAVVLPFDVPLDGNGYMKSDPSVLYCNITRTDTLTSIRKGDGADLTWAVLADSVVGVETAEANMPYYVANKAEDGLGFTYNIQNAQFRKTGTLSTDGTKVDFFEPLSRTEGAWTTKGTYSGEQVQKDNLRWYFSKDFFWKSGVLKSSNHFNVRPFRAWFETETDYTQTQLAVVFDPSEFVTDGIGSAAAEAASLQVASGHGFISVAAGVSAKVAVRTLAGQLVYAGNLSAGEARRFNVAKGVYLVNNVKVVVR